MARPSLRVDRTSVPATVRRDGWSPNGIAERHPGTEPGLQAGSSARTLLFGVLGKPPFVPVTISDMAEPGEVKAARNRAGLTQQQLADILGVHVKTLRDYEKGKRARLRVGQAKLADFIAAHPEPAAPAAVSPAVASGLRPLAEASDMELIAVLTARLALLRAAVDGPIPVAVEVQAPTVVVHTMVTHTTAAAPTTETASMPTSPGVAATTNGTAQEGPLDDAPPSTPRAELTSAPTGAPTTEPTAVLSGVLNGVLGGVLNGVPTDDKVSQAGETGH